MRSPTWRALLQSLSLFVTGFVLVVVFAVHTGLAGRGVVLPVLLTLASAIAVRYAAVHHRFSNSTYRTVALALAAVAFVASSAVALEAFLTGVSSGAFRRVVRRGAVRPGSTEFLPEWWIAVFLAIAGVLALAGATSTRDVAPYPKPTTLREVATSPVYFGLACATVGLWAVLFVGIAIQRVLVVAPLFEELLKFGVALLVGSALFGRSLSARIGVAVVVGSLFGLVEHATTYPMEPDVVYLFRTLFHSTTTVLSVGTYTLFESREEGALRWISPAYSIVLHFFHNTFAVLSGVGSVVVFGSQSDLLPLVYGSAAIVVAAGLFLLVVVYPAAIVAIHRPLEHVLSDLV